MSKHTQGPWESWIAGSSFGVTGPAAADAFIMRLASLKDNNERSKCIIDIASACGVQPGIALGDTQEEAEANARLIAAAPDLLEALQLLLRWVDEPSESALDMVREQKHIEQARAAIAKANGEEA